MIANAAHVAMHDDADAVVEDAVRTGRAISGLDSACAAVAGDAGRFDMTVLDGIAEPRFREISVRPGLGLGGQVLAERRALAIDDYLTEPSITADFRPIVAREGLRGIACVPLYGPNGIEVLLYATTHRPGRPGDAAIQELERVAGWASIGLHHIAARARERELAILRERQRLATALHDSVAQSLFAIGVAAQHSRRSGDPAIVIEQLEEIESTAATARAELRETLARLSRAPEGMAFESLFEAELRLFERRTGRPVWITRHGEPRSVGEDPEELLIDGLREGLRNAVKHGDGEVVLAHLAYEPARVTLSLQTELGSPSRDVLPRRPELALTPGSGLSLLRDRADRLGGALELVCDDDGIAVLRIELPA